MAPTIGRTAIVDDSGTGTDGTVLSNAWKTEFYGQIDALAAVLNAGASGDYAVTGDLLVSAIAPTILAGNTDNWAPGAATVLHVAASGAINLTGMVPNAGNSSLLSQIRILVNVGSFTITLKHETTSTAANRFFLSGAADLPLVSNGIRAFLYTGTRWQPIISN